MNDSLFLTFFFVNLLGFEINSVSLLFPFQNTVHMCHLNFLEFKITSLELDHQEFIKQPFEKFEKNYLEFKLWKSLFVSNFIKVF